MDQNDGEYVGWLGGDLNVSEDPAVEQGGKEPVVVEISEDGQRLNVHPVGPDDKDMLLKSAGLIRYVVPSPHSSLSTFPPFVSGSVMTAKDSPKSVGNTVEE